MYKEKYVKYKKKYLNLINLLEQMNLVGGGKNKAENLYYTNIVENFSNFRKISEISEEILDEIEKFIRDNKKKITKDILFSEFPILERILRSIESKIEQISDLKITDESERDKIERIRNNSNIYDVIIKFYINNSLGSIENIDSFIEYYEDFKLLRENNENYIFKIEKVSLNGFNNLLELINYNQQNEPLLQKHMSGLTGGSIEDVRNTFYDTISDSKKYKNFYTSLNRKIDIETLLPTPTILETEKNEFKQKVTGSLREEINRLKDIKSKDKSNIEILKLLKQLEKEEKNIINVEMERFKKNILPTLFENVFERLLNLFRERIHEIHLNKALQFYLSGNLKTEDIPNSIENIEIFNRNIELFKKIEEANLNYQEKKIMIDINNFYNFDEFIKFMLSKESILNNIKYKKSEALKMEIGKKEIEIILDTDKVKVLIPLSEEASKFWGLGTKWCTAAKNNNQFNNYYSKGDIYIVISKLDNNKYQLQFEDEQYMNAEDEAILLDDLKKSINDEELNILLDKLKNSYKFVSNNSTNISTLSNIKSLKLGMLYNINDTTKIPNTVENLDIKSLMNRPIDEILIQPSKLKRLTVVLGVNILPNTLPESLLFLKMYIKENVLNLDQDVLPKNLNSLSLIDYEYELKPNDLPINLKHLKLKNLKGDFGVNVLPNLLTLKLYGRNISYTNLPMNLKELHIYLIYSSRYPGIPERTLPINLEKLYLRSYYHNIKKNTLPENLKILKIYEINYIMYNIENDSLPLNLVELYVGDHKIEFSELKKLKKLKILQISNIEIKENDIPEGIETLEFCSMYSFDININYLPKTIKNIIIPYYYREKILNENDKIKISRNIDTDDFVI